MNQITRRVLSHHLFKKLKFVQQSKHCCCHVASTGQRDIIKDQRHFSTASSSNKKILSVSSLLLQDGLDIDELPIIIRHSDRSTFPFNDTGNPQSEKTMKHESQADKQFKSHIQECASVKQIFQLLEIPSDFVNVLSATNALFKICQLQNDNKGLDDLHSFIHKAIMNELCDTVSNEVCILTNDRLIAVFQYSKRSHGILERCSSSVVQEIERRIGDGRFSIDELCLLAETLHTPHKDKKQRQLHKYLWIHIGNRYKDISETNVAKVLRLYPRSIKHEHYIKLIGNQIAVFWWKLRGEDFASVVTSLIQLNYHDNRLFSRLARWFSINVHAVREIDLMVMLTAYNRLKHPVLHFFETLEKYVAAKIDKIDVNLLALIVQLCRTKKFLSPIILDAAASHFIQHGQGYTPLQLLTILRCFGHLNYLPNEPTEFLFKVESVLDEAFDDLGVERICAILSSFAMIGKVSMNLAPRVFDELFLIRIKDLPDLRQDKVKYWLKIIFTSALVDRKEFLSVSKMAEEFLKSTDPGKKSNIYEVYANRHVRCSLERIFEVKMKHYSILNRGVNKIDFEILLNHDGKLLPLNNRKIAHIKLAVIQLYAHHFCINRPHKVGIAAMQYRHLKSQGYEILEMPIDFNYFDDKVTDKFIIEQLQQIYQQVKNT